MSDAKFSVPYAPPASSMNASMSCTTKPPNWSEHKAKYTNDFFRTALKEDKGQVIYVTTRYVVLYNRQDQQPSLACIKDNHRTANLMFSMQNTDQLAKCPNTTLYPFKPRIGNPLIQLLPLDEEEIKVEYVKINTTYLDDNDPCDDAASKGHVTPGVLNIYFGECKSGILGQSQLPGNCVFVDWRTVGGFRYPGRLANYQYGATKIHECGHAFALPHPFADSCDKIPVYEDIPEIFQPNFTAELYQRSDGQWEGKGDNRYNDRMYGTHNSCLSVQDNPSTQPNEAFMTVMDYAGDAHIVGFTKSQVVIMRTYLLGPENKTLNITTGNLVIDPNGGTHDITTGDADTNYTAPSSANSSALDTGATASSTSLSTAGIVGISVGAAVGASVIGVLIYYAIMKNKNKSPK